MVKTAENNRARFSQLFGEGPGDALIEQQERASVDVGKGPGKQAQRNTAAAFQVRRRTRSLVWICPPRASRAREAPSP